MSQKRRECKNVMLIGYQRTGKTSLASKFLFDYFPQTNQDYFIDRHSSKIMKLNSTNVEVKVIDMHSLVSSLNLELRLFYKLLAIQRECPYLYVLSRQSRIFQLGNQIKPRFKKSVKTYTTSLDTTFPAS
jgi:hypothetical protein